MEQVGEAYTKVGPGTPCPSQGSQHRRVSAGGLQSKLYGDRPARWFGEGTTSVPSLTLCIPRHRGGQQGRAGPRLSKELPGQPFIPQPARDSSQSKDRCWHKDTKEPQANLPHQRCTSMQQKRHFPKYERDFCPQTSHAPRGHRGKSKLRGEAEIVQTAFSPLSLSHEAGMTCHSLNPVKTKDFLPCRMLVIPPSWLQKLLPMLKNPVQMSPPL